MTEQDRALGGDGLVKLFLSEIKSPSKHIGYNIVSIYSSNEIMAKAYCELMKIDLHYSKYHFYGTKYEAMIYDVFKKDGYEASKNLFIETIINFVDKNQNKNTREG